MRENRAVAWKIRGSYVETCSCDLICPCNASFDHGATYDYCRVVLAFDIKEGEIDGTDTAGLRVVAVADTPKVMTDGNWKLGMYIDERATDEQAEKLGQVFSGQLGGPMAALSSLVGEVLGVERAAIDMEDDGLLHRVRVGDTVDFEIQDIVPFGVETGRPIRFDGMFHPAGSNLTIAEATRSRINAFGIEYEGKTGLSTSEFAWAACPVVTRAQPSAPSAGSASALMAVRARLGLVALLFALAAVAWWSTVDRMSGMDGGPWTTLGSFGWFLGVWVVMMAAMMLPSVSPTVALYARMTRRRAPLSPLLFTGGYLLTWAGAGALAFLVAVVARNVGGDGLDWADAGRWVAGGTLVIAALY